MVQKKIKKKYRLFQLFNSYIKLIAKSLPLISSFKYSVNQELVVI